MRPFHDSAAPCLDLGLERRLRSLDPNLLVTYSPWSIDPRDGQPIEDLDGQPVAEPAHHLWIRQPSGKYHHIDLFPMALGGFGYLNLRYLEANKRATETRSPVDIYRLMQTRNELLRETSARKHREHRQDRAQANKKRIGDLVFNGKSGRRQAKISSYPGQVRHSTPGDVLRDAREDGWELE